MFVSVEHFLAKGEETLRGYVVVFQHDALVGHRESPFLRDIFGGVAAVVALLVQVFHVAFPVYVGGNAAASLNAGHVFLASRSVLIQKKSRWARLFHRLENLFKGFGTIKKQYQYGNLVCFRPLLPSRRAQQAQQRGGKRAIRKL